MEKDIDDLLDEVETKFVRNTKQEPKTSNSKGVSASRKKKDGIDEMIDGILDLDLPDDLKDVKCATKGQSSVRAAQSDIKLEQTKKCFPVFLGGAADIMGRGSGVSSRACDMLRCTACDFCVCVFDNLAWSQDTDYLFLRNNVPNLQKLQLKLNRKKGCRAYCCQCSWRNVGELAQLADPNLKWVCGKHSL